MRYVYSENDNPLANDYYYEASYMRYEKFPSIPTHVHNYYEIYIFLGSSVRLSIEGSLYDVKKGNVIVIPPYTVHQLVHADSFTMPYTRLLTYISEGCLKSLQFNEHGLLSSLKLAADRKMYQFTISDPKDFESIYYSMSCLNNNKNSTQYGAELLNRSYILQFMTLICRNIRENITPQDILHVNPLMEQILSYINGNYEKDISMDTLSEMFYVNKSTLAKEFKNHTAQTIHSYLTMKRISVAKQEMASGTPPSQVYLLTGFKEYSTFYRTFHKLEGISPKTFFHNCNSRK